MLKAEVRYALREVVRPVDRVHDPEPAFAPALDFGGGLLGQDRVVRDIPPEACRGPPPRPRGLSRSRSCRALSTRYPARAVATEAIQDDRRSPSPRRGGRRLPLSAGGGDGSSSSHARPTCAPGRSSPSGRGAGEHQLRCGDELQARLGQRLVVGQHAALLVEVVEGRRQSMA